MPTIQYGGYGSYNGVPVGAQTVTFQHPREIPMKSPNPIPPLQPIANWAGSLTAFQAMCTNGQFEDAIKWLRSEYVYATVSDVPSPEALAAFRDWIRFNRRTIPPTLHGPISDWSPGEIKGRDFL
jgi:hypothetical protein